MSWGCEQSVLGFLQVFLRVSKEACLGTMAGFGNQFWPLSLLSSVVDFYKAKSFSGHAPGPVLGGLPPSFGKFSVIDSQAMSLWESKMAAIPEDVNSAQFQPCYSGS